MNRLEKTVLVIGYAAIGWGLWAMPSFSSTADASIGAKILCTSVAPLTAQIVETHDATGWSVTKIRSEIDPTGELVSPVTNYAFARAHMAILDDENREGLVERVWRECLEGAS